MRLEDITNPIRMGIGSLLLMWFGFLFFTLGGVAFRGKEAELGPTVLFLGAVVVLGSAGALIRWSRGLGKVVAKADELASNALHDAAPSSDFDAQAAIDRYLANRPAGSGDTGEPPAVPEAARPVFGRKAR